MTVGLQAGSGLEAPAPLPDGASAEGAESSASAAAVAGALAVAGTKCTVLVTRSGMLVSLFFPKPLSRRNSDMIFRLWKSLFHAESTSSTHCQPSLLILPRSSSHIAWEKTLSMGTSISWGGSPYASGITRIDSKRFMSCTYVGASSSAVTQYSNGLLFTPATFHVNIASSPAPLGFKPTSCTAFLFGGWLGEAGALLGIEPFVGLVALLSSWVVEDIAMDTTDVAAEELTVVPVCTPLGPPAAPPFVVGACASFWRRSTLPNAAAAPVACRRR
mmetsp:Transcript_19010/g.44345  ORF Transcript_19010/g.44345 Transcript_19010/m.44345 type:complete len:274 (+) Transcript_19010:1231-2052(+)